MGGRVICVLALLASVASAQATAPDAPAAGSAATPAATTAPEAAPGTTAPDAFAAPDPAWALYDRAFERLGRHEEDAARADLHRLVAQVPAHPGAHAALSRLTDLGNAQPKRGPQVAGPPRRGGRRERLVWT